MKKSIVGMFVLAILATGSFSFFTISPVVNVVRIEASISNETNTAENQAVTINEEPELGKQQQQGTNEKQEVVTPNHLPNANAGPDKKIEEGSNVVLDAARSSDPDPGDKLVYLWRQVSGRPLVTLENAGTSIGSFVAPNVNRDTTLAFLVTVRDGNGAQDTDPIRVLVRNVDTSPSTTTDQTSNTNANTNANTNTNPRGTDALDNGTQRALLNAQRNNNINNDNMNNLSRLEAVATGDANMQFSPSSVSTLAVISGTVALQTNNIVNTRAYYDVLFRTGTSANINKIDVTFPSGTNIGSVRILEVSGVPAGGGVSKSGQTVTYTIPSSPLVPANTVIRMGYANIINPATPGSSFSVQIATKTSGGSVIDSGTSVSYAIKQIGSSDLADNSVTTANQFSSKLADKAVITSKIEDNAVTTAKIAGDSITSTKILDGQVGTNDLAPGAVSLTLFERSSPEVTLAPGENGVASAVCAPGEMLSGGGYFTDSTSASVIIVTSSSQGAFNTWTVSAFNYAGSAGTFRADAECLKVTP